MLEKTLESPLDCKEIQPVHPKGNPPWIFIGRTDAQAVAPIFGHLVWRRWLTGKDPDAGKDWGQEEKGVTEVEMVGWHHCLNWHEFEQTPGDSEGQGSLACYSPWGHTQLSNWTTTNYGEWFHKAHSLIQGLSGPILEHRQELIIHLHHIWPHKSLHLGKPPIQYRTEHCPWNLQLAANINQ